MVAIESHDVIRSIPLKSDLNSVAYNATNSLLVICTSDRKVRLFDARSLDELPCSPLTSYHSYPVSCCAFSKSQAFLVTCAIDGLLVVLDLQSISDPKVFCKFTAGQLKSCNFSDNCSFVAAGDTEGKVNVWSMCSKELIHVCGGHSAQVTGLVFTPDSNWLVSGCSGMGTGDLWVWPIGEKRRLELMPQQALEYDSCAHEMGLYCMAFSPKFSTASGSWLLATGGGDNSVKFWTVDKSRQPGKRLLSRATLQYHTYIVTGCSFSPDGTLFCSVSLDHTAAIWDPRSSNLLYVMMDHTRFVAACSWSPDNRTLASGGNDKQVLIWRIKRDTDLVDDAPTNYSQLTSPAANQESDITNAIILSAENNVPDEFLCPISHEVMKDPVVAADGFSYERSAIQTWVTKSHTSPITNLPLPSFQFIPNRTLKSLISSQTNKLQK